MTSNQVELSARYEIPLRHVHEYRQVSGTVLVKLMNARTVLPTTRVIKLG